MTDDHAEQSTESGDSDVTVFSVVDDETLLDVVSEVIDAAFGIALKPVQGDALAAASFARHVHGCEVLVQLVGTPKPAPWKGASFRAVDRASALASLDAALEAHVAHYVYLSVAQPAPVMRAYVAVRAECEARIAASGIAATFVRPWYVIGPGHRWPLVLAPVYTVLGRVPATRASAVRLGLVRLGQVVERGGDHGPARRRRCPGRRCLAGPRRVRRDRPVPPPPGPGVLIRRAPDGARAPLRGLRRLSWSDVPVRHARGE